ncbi:MAG TPA: FmdB family zinc ribbon protein [Acidimicrobiia bacterium]|nr:FmdB family zinc ribbon protein [Acidimicrobiia bacterium]
MPTYDYRCAKCGEDLEVYQTFAEAPLTKHKGCGGKLARVLSPAGIVLKGSGFYKTDNRSSAKRSGGTEARNGDSGDSSGSSADTKSSESSGSGSGGSGEKKADTSSGSGSGSNGSGSGSSVEAKKPAAKSA